MIRQFKLPVIDTEKGKYEYKGPEISVEEYNKMVQEDYDRTKYAVQDLMHGRLDRRRTNYRPNNERNYTDSTLYSYRTFEAAVVAKNGEEIEPDVLNEYIDNEKMIIIRLNINPESLYNDEFGDNFASEEIKFWADDSSRVRRDMSLDKKTKLKRLPVRDLIMVTENGEYLFNDCRIVEDNSSKNAPYRYFILVNKIIRNK